MSSPVVVADGLHFPTGVAFGADGAIYVAESGLAFGGAPAGGRVWRYDGGRELLADGLAAPVTGLCWHETGVYVAEGGAGRICRFDGDGNRQVIVDGMPGPGNYHTNMPVVGPDGKLYFSQGAMTNLGVVGLDAYELGWLRRLPHAHDVPGVDVTLAGVNVSTADPVSGADEAMTGAFVPFGTKTKPGQRISAALPCTAAVLRCDLDGAGLELVAWGLRNAFGLGFLPDGRLLAVDQGADDRGSRPIGAAPDLLCDVRAGRWYGWPDFVGDEPVTADRFTPQRGPRPTFLLADHGELPSPERPLVTFQPHAAATKFAVVPADVPRFAGHLVVTLFGDEAPMTAPSGHPRVGRTLIRVDPADWSTHPLRVPAVVRRPIDVAVNRPDAALYVLDFGLFEMSDQGVVAEAGSGRLLRWENWAAEE